MKSKEEEGKSLNGTIEKEELLSSSTPEKQYFDHGNFEIECTDNKALFR